MNLMIDDLVNWSIYIYIDTSCKNRPQCVNTVEDWCITSPILRIKWNTDSKVHGANMGPIWGRQGPGGPHVGPMNFAIWESTLLFTILPSHMGGFVMAFSTIQCSLCSGYYGISNHLQQLFVQQLVQASNTDKQNITGPLGGESIMVIMVYAGMTQLN